MEGKLTKIAVYENGRPDSTFELTLTFDNYKHEAVPFKLGMGKGEIIKQLEKLFFNISNHIEG